MKATTQERAAAGAPGRLGRNWASVRQFFRDSFLELQKVIWPTKEEVLKMTGLVVVVVIVVSVFMFAWDQVVAQVTTRLFGR